MDGLMTLQAKVTKTAAPFNGAGVDVSGVAGDYTVVLRVTQLTGKARISFADSVDAFTGSIPGPSFHFTGDIGQANPQNPNPIVKSFSRREYSLLRQGTANAVLRVQLDQLSGAGATIEYEAYIQYQKNVTYVAAGGLSADVELYPPRRVPPLHQPGYEIPRYGDGETSPDAKSRPGVHEAYEAHEQQHREEQLQGPRPGVQHEKHNEDVSHDPRSQGPHDGPQDLAGTKEDPSSSTGTSLHTPRPDKHPPEKPKTPETKPPDKKDK